MKGAPNSGAGGVKELISLEVSQIGFVVYGIGPGAKDRLFHGVVLMDFLDATWQKMWSLKKQLNKLWRKLNRKDLTRPSNKVIINRFLNAGAWAYALTVALSPFAPFCKHGPTDPLHSMFTRRLEEIYTRCFAMAHCFGSIDQSITGLRGLLTDFELNGGVDQKTGGLGAGFFLSIRDYFTAYFVASNHEPIVYEKFADLIMALYDMIVMRYPALAVLFAQELHRLIHSEDNGFGDKSITSEAKSIMLLKLNTIAQSLAVIVPSVRKAA